MAIFSFVCKARAVRAAVADGGRAMFNPAEALHARVGLSSPQLLAVRVYSLPFQGIG